MICKEQIFKDFYTLEMFSSLITYLPVKSDILNFFI